MYTAAYTFAVIVMIAVVIKLVDIHLGPQIQRSMLNNPRRAEAWLAMLERQDIERFKALDEAVNKALSTFTIDDWKTLILADFAANKVPPPNDDLVYRLALQKSRIARQVLVTRD